MDLDLIRLRCQKIVNYFFFIIFIYVIMIIAATAAAAANKFIIKFFLHS